MNNLEKGGEDYQRWVYKIIKLLGWEPKDDIKLYAYDKLFSLYERCMTPEEAMRNLKTTTVYLKDQLK